MTASAALRDWALRKSSRHFIRRGEVAASTASASLWIRYHWHGQLEAAYGRLWLYLRRRCATAARITEPGGIRR